MRSIIERSEGLQDALERIFIRHKGERLVVFTATDDEAIGISHRFLVPALLSQTRKGERGAFLSAFVEGRFPVLVSARTVPERHRLRESYLGC